MKGEYDDVGFPADPAIVRKTRCRRYIAFAGGHREEQKLCPGCGKWKSIRAYWSNRARCKMCMTNERN